MNREIIKKLWHCYRNLIFYCLIGCSGAGLDFIIYTFFTSYTDIHYQTANILSCSCGIINNFILNYFFNFKTHDHFLLRLLSFYSVGLIGLGITSLLLYLLIDCMGVSKVIAKLAAIFIVTIIQYTFNKYISFRSKANKC